MLILDVGFVCLSICLHVSCERIGLYGNESIAISTIALNTRLLIISLKDVRAPHHIRFVCVFTKVEK